MDVSVQLRHVIVIDSGQWGRESWRENREIGAGQAVHERGESLRCAEQRVRHFVVMLEQTDVVLLVLEP